VDFLTWQDFFVLHEVLQSAQSTNLGHRQFRIKSKIWSSMIKPNNFIGLCEKNSDGVVIFQNDVCRNICGNQKGEKCNFGCMKQANTDEKKYNFSILHNIFDDSEKIVDAVKLNTVRSIYTILYDKTNMIKSLLSQIKSYHLTNTEINIYKLITMGYSNKEIASKLFVSKKTIHTHINNIYKKIPSKLKQNRDTK
jgi:DNA-binding CsgD family transcriptional regulator